MIYLSLMVIFPILACRTILEEDFRQWSGFAFTIWMMFFLLDISTSTDSWEYTKLKICTMVFLTLTFTVVGFLLYVGGQRLLIRLALPPEKSSGSPES